MGIDTRCKLMVGLEYETIKEHVGDTEELDENIHDGVLDCGRCYYDSSFEDNIIGFDVVKTSSYTKIDTIGTLHAKVIESTKEFNKIFPDLTPQIYMTLDIV